MAELPPLTPELAKTMLAWVREHRVAPRPQASPAPAKNRPSMAAMAGNLTKAVAAHVADGGRKASPEVQADRLSICQACPSFDAEKIACRSCGCGTVVKGGLELKISWASSKCPLNPPKWTAV